MSDDQEEKPQHTSPDRRSLSTKKWVEQREDVRKTALEENMRGAKEAARKDMLAQDGYSNPKGVWIGLAVAVFLVVAGYWIFDTLRCNPLESDIALARDGTCR